MSVIRQKPFIEELISSLSIENIKEFRNLLNEGGDNVKLSFATLTNAYKNKVTPVYFELDNLNIKTALLVWSNTLCALVCYHRFQDILLIELNTTNHTYKKVNEYCDINELRRIVDDVLETKGAEILVVNGTSGELTDAEIEQAKMPDTVLRAGDDGAFYYKESQNEDYIVFKAFPRIEEGTTYLENITIDLSDNTYSYTAEAISAGEGFSPEYDTELNNSSTNAPQTKVVDAALTELETEIENGAIVPLTTKNIQPISENSGTIQDTPFIYQGTGTDNNTSETPTSPVGKQLEKQGNSVVVNQIYGRASNFSKTITGITFNYNASTDLITINGTATSLIQIYEFGGNITRGHNNLCSIKLISGTYTGGNPRIMIGGNGNYAFTINDSPKIINLPTSATSVQRSLQFYADSGAVFENAVFEIKTIDLTQWFGSNDSIPSDLLTNPSHFINYYNGSLEYNTGELKNSDGEVLETIGFNQWDEETEIGDINTTTGENTSSSNNLRSKNYIRVISNTTYYFKAPKNVYLFFYDKDKNFIRYTDFAVNNTFTTPINCSFIRFRINPQYGTTYNHDICINLSWDGQRDGEYQPYVKHTYNTGSEVLRSAGSVRDVKTPDGTITRKVGSYTFTGNEAFSSFETYGSYSELPSLLGMKTQNTNILIAGFQTLTSGVSTTIMSCSLGQALNINVNNVGADVRTYMIGKTIYFELATPTTEQGTSFAENIEIDDYGTMGWTKNDEYVTIPQGCKIFYPVDYVLLLDDLNNYTNGDVTKLALKSDINTMITTFLTSITGYDNTKTQVLKQVEGTLTWVDEENQQDDSQD